MFTTKTILYDWVDLVGEWDVEFLNMTASEGAVCSGLTLNVILSTKQCCCFFYFHRSRWSYFKNHQSWKVMANNKARKKNTVFKRTRL